MTFKSEQQPKSERLLKCEDFPYTWQVCKPCPQKIPHQVLGTTGKGSKATGEVILVVKYQHCSQH